VYGEIATARHCMMYLIDGVDLEWIIIYSWRGDRINSCLQLCKRKTMSLMISSQMINERQR